MPGKELQQVLSSKGKEEDKVPTIFYVSYIAMWMLLLIEGLLLLLVYRHFGLAALATIEGVQRDGLKVGDSAFPIEGVTAQGEQIQWSPGSGRSCLLAFVSPNCSPCERILPSILQLATANSQLEVTLVVTGPKSLATKLRNKFHLPSSITCLADEGERIHEDYRVRVTPFAFMVGGDGRVCAKGLCDTVERLQALLSAGGHDVPVKFFARV